MTLSRVTNGEALGPSGSGINLKTLSRIRFDTCCGMQQRHSAISVPRSTGSFGNFSAPYRAGMSRVSNWKFRAHCRVGFIFHPPAGTVETMISSGKIKSTIWRNSSCFAWEVSGSAQRPANSNRLWRNTRTSRRVAPGERMSKAQRSLPLSMRKRASRVLRFKNIAAAANGTNGRRSVKPKLNLTGTGGTGFEGRRQMDLDLGGIKGTRTIFMSQNELE